MWYTSMSQALLRFALLVERVEQLAEFCQVGLTDLERRK